MAGLNITTEQLRTIMQSIQNRFIRLELLNYQFQTVDTLEGIATSGSVTIDANSDIRRTASITLTIIDGGLEVKSGGKIWLDKYIKLWVGTQSFGSGEIEWTNCGIFIIDPPSYQFDATTNTLALGLLDLMAKLTGIRNGYLKGAPTVFKAGENIRKAIIDTLALGGFTKYVVEEAPEPGTIPNDLEFNLGATVYDLLNGLRKIYPDYEMFFDTEGTFYYKEIPNGIDDPVLIDDTIWNHITISEQIDVDFQNVKNSIEVFGRTHDPKHYSETANINGKVINLTIEDVKEYKEDLIYGFTLKDNPGYTDMQLQINSLPALPIMLDDGKTPAKIVAETGEIYFCVQYKNTYWNWLGHLQAYGFAEDTNPESPFYVEGTVGRIRLPLYDSEYDNCLTDNLAQQRAEYELWLHTNMNNSVSLTCVPVPWFNVNIKVDYTGFRNRETNQYIIKSVSYGLAPGDTMSISMIKFYPSTPEITKGRS